MNPSIPFIIAESASVVDVARIMAGKRADAVLITDDAGNGELKGIVTDKDLAFRCIAEGFDPVKTKVGQIMTKLVY